MQKVRFASLVGCSLTLLFSSAGASAAPQKFTAYIGGFLGVSYEVNWTGQELLYSVRDGGKMTVRARLKPTDAQWQAFKSALQKAGVPQWRASYLNTGALDGTQWSLTIKFREFKASSSGSNSYPVSPLQNDQPNNNPAYTPTFNAYLKAVEQLLGARPFR